MLACLLVDSECGYCCTDESFTPASFSNDKAFDNDAVAFLFDMFQMTLRLQIIRGRRYDLLPDEIYDISIFKGLEALRLTDIDCARIAGIKWLRSHTKKVQCTGGERGRLSSLDSLFVTCGHDNTASSTPWTSLNTVICTDHQLDEMDLALSLMSCVSTLDLSNNFIPEVTENMRHLTALKVLKLRNNHITSLSVLASTSVAQALHGVTLLDVGGNRIGSLHGIENLVTLITLDARANEIDSFSEIHRLRGLINLRELWLAANPIATVKHKTYLNCGPVAGILCITSLLFHFCHPNATRHKSR